MVTLDGTALLLMLIETKTSRCGKSLGISPGNTRTARPFELKLVCFFPHVTHQKFLNL